MQKISKYGKPVKKDPERDFERNVQIASKVSLKNNEILTEML